MKTTNAKATNAKAARVQVAGTKGKKPAAAPAKGKAKPEAPKGDGRGPGVVALILKTITGASAKSPVSKRDLHAALTKAFPDRDPLNLLSTINAQVPGRIAKERGLAVTRVAEGYYAEPATAKRPAGAYVNVGPKV